MRELTNVVEDWEVKAKNLMTEHDIDLDSHTKVALLTAMLPADLQDYVFQWSDGKSTYEEMRDPIISMAINRVSMSKLVPMEGTRRSTTMRVTGSRSRRNSWRSVTWESRAGSVEELVTTPESAPLPKGSGKELGSQISNRTTKGSQRGRGSQTTGTFFGKGKCKGKGKTF